MKILVCGGRKFNDREFMDLHLTQINKCFTEEGIGFQRIISGAANGVDTIAEEWAKANNIETDIYPISKSDWNTYGKRAGYIRNKKMRDEGKPDYAMAFPGNAGTKMMIDLLKEQSIPYWESKTLLFKKESIKYGFLSNFATGFEFVDDDGLVWQTSEHYYQALKTPIETEKSKIQNASTPNAAKKLGNSKDMLIYQDWNDKKVDAMLETLLLKFSYGSKAEQLLLETYPDYLVEYAPWGDTFWGVDSNMKGLNMLGKLLNMIRDYKYYNLL